MSFRDFIEYEILSKIAKNSLKRTYHLKKIAFAFFALEITPKDHLYWFAHQTQRLINWPECRERRKNAVHSLCATFASTKARNFITADRTLRKNSDIFCKRSSLLCHFRINDCCPNRETDTEIHALCDISICTWIVSRIHSRMTASLKGKMDSTNGIRKSAVCYPERGILYRASERVGQSRQCGHFSPHMRGNNRTLIA